MSPSHCGDKADFLYQWDDIFILNPLRTITRHRFELKSAPNLTLSILLGWYWRWGSSTFPISTLRIPGDGVQCCYCILIEAGQGVLHVATCIEVYPLRYDFLEIIVCLNDGLAPNQWWPYLVTHICCTEEKWVKACIPHLAWDGMHGYICYVYNIKQITLLNFNHNNWMSICILFSENVFLTSYFYNMLHVSCHSFGGGFTLLHHSHMSATTPQNIGIFIICSAAS